MRHLCKHCRGFFRGILCTLIDAIVACVGHFVRCCLVACASCDCSVSVCVCVCVCVHVSIVVCMKLCYIADDQK